MENPDVLPFNGLDRDGVRDIHALLQGQKAQGRVMLLASHSAADIAEACDVVYEMNAGALHPIEKVSA